MLLPHRVAETVLVPPAPDEAALYADIVESVRVGATASASSRLALRVLARLAGLEPSRGRRHAGQARLGRSGRARPGGSRPAQDARAARPARAGTSRAARRCWCSPGFGRPWTSLVAAVARAGRRGRRVPRQPVAHGRRTPRWPRFAADTPVLLSTESAGEGRNLQFCHVMVNFDLPWNPMQIEQRLGRLHRIGQEHDVTLTNLVSRGTIEQRVLHVLEAKINLFELVVGELDMILGRVDDDFDFETAVFDALSRPATTPNSSASRHAGRRAGRRAPATSQPRRGRPAGRGID